MEIVVVGAGIAGLGTALMLGTEGHAVTLLERDPAPPDDAEEAWASWERRGVPQSRLAHVFLARMRNALRDDHPDLYADLLAAGATEIAAYDLMPDTITDRTRTPDDDDLVMLGIRRVVLEHHIRRALAAMPNVDVRSSTPVADVSTGPSVADGIPHVTGVTLEDGSTLTCDLVVDCGGRRSALPRWLESIGAAAMPEENVEDGLMYFGRYYRLEPGQSFPAHGSPVTDLGFLGALTFEADDGWFAIALAVHNEDKEIRALQHEDAFEAALAAIPATSVWRTPGRSRPMTEVKTMSRIDDRWRDLVVDGRPLVTGLVAVGDSVVATNPAFGRGASLAWVAGRALTEAVGECGDDPVDLALAYDEARLRLLRGWFDQQVQMDIGRLETMRRVLAGEPPIEPDLDDPSAAFGLGLQLASQVDAAVYRGMISIGQVLATPMEVLADPDVAAAAVAAFENRATAVLPPAGPTRDELLAAMAPRSASEAQAGSPAAVG
jgi:2-polyprenyl-6-methoxyphenol hydroxylase-like FAD-dependent oxidoreductase